MKEKQFPAWMQLEDETEEMNKLKSLLFCMEAATGIEETGQTFSLDRLTPALRLAQDLVENTQERLSELQEIEHQNTIKLKEGVVA